MITPLEIENKKLSKSFRGYSVDEVNTFLDEIIKDYGKLYIQNQEFRGRMEDLENEVFKYNNLENTLKETLLIAKTTGEDIIKTARDKAEIIIADAELKSINDTTKNERNLEKLNSEINILRMEFNAMKSKYKSFLESQIKTIDEIKLED